MLKRINERNRKIGERLKEMGIIGPTVFDYYELRQIGSIQFTAHHLDFDRLEAYYQEQLKGKTKENDRSLLEAVERFIWQHKFLRICMSHLETPFQVEYNEKRDRLSVYSRGLSDRTTALTSEETKHLIRTSQKWGYAEEFKKIQLIKAFQPEKARDQTLELLDEIGEKIEDDLEKVKKDLKFRIDLLMEEVKHLDIP